jgi:ribosomal peptide maturation radical SAM protein 1
MQRVHLIDMPFGTLELPSLALTQLASRLKDLFPGQVSTQILYLNHDFGDYLGIPLYQDIAHSAEHFHSGIGEWFFRQSAFPGVPDNREEYFSRYYREPDPSSTQIREVILEKRETIDTFLDYLIDEYEIDHSHIVGFSSMFAQNLGSIAMARRLKARNPSLTTVMGGANCESPMGEEISRHVNVIDYVFSGPALVSFPTFIQYTLDGLAAQRGDIRGVLAKPSNRLPSQLPLLDSQSPRAAIGKDLDIDVPVPLDYGSFLDGFEQRFAATGLEPALLLETSRGCWWGERAHCTFCGLNGVSMGYRAMNPDTALAYLSQLLQYAPRCPRFMAVDNIMPKNFVRDVWPHLHNKEKALIFYEVKADMSGDDLAVLSKAGVKKIQPGIEALATSTLKLMKKGTTGCANIRFLMNCLMNEVSPVWNLLVGFPGETAVVFERYVQEIPKLVHIPPPLDVFPVRFDRYSPYFNNANEYGLQLRPFDFYQLVYPFDTDSIANLAYYFSDDSLDEYQRAMVEWFAAIKAKVAAWRERWVGTLREPPTLYACNQDGETVVVDTRFAEKSCSTVSAEVAWLLTHLRRPRSLEEVFRSFCATFGKEAIEALSTLRERQWLFEDGEKTVGLVLERAAPPMTTWVS